MHVQEDVAALLLRLLKYTLPYLEELARADVVFYGVHLLQQRILPPPQLLLSLLVRCHLWAPRQQSLINLHPAQRVRKAVVTCLQEQLIVELLSNLCRTDGLTKMIRVRFFFAPLLILVTHFALVICQKAIHFHLLRDGLLLVILLLVRITFLS